MPHFESHYERVWRIGKEEIDTFPVCKNEKNSYDKRFNNDFAYMKYELDSGEKHISYAPNPKNVKKKIVYDSSTIEDEVFINP
jgi:hypothetical protein